MASDVLRLFYAIAKSLFFFMLAVSIDQSCDSDVADAEESSEALSKPGKISEATSIRVQTDQMRCFFINTVRPRQSSDDCYG